MKNIFSLILFGALILSFSTTLAIQRMRVGWGGFSGFRGPSVPISRPSVPIIRPVTPIAKPATPTTKPVTPITPVTPATPVTKPVTPVEPVPTQVTSINPVNKPVTPITPATPVTEPVTPDAKPLTPENPVTEPVNKPSNPGDPVTKPVTPKNPVTEPTTKPVNPSDPVKKPVTSENSVPESADPGDSATNPVTPVNPVTEPVNSVDSVTEPVTIGEKLSSESKAIAAPKSTGTCAKAVRTAVQKARGEEVKPTGIKSAKNYGEWLKNNNCHSKGKLTSFETGDIAVMKGSEKHKHGHIQIYGDDGIWRSDFVQKGFYPYKDGSKPDYEIYRCE